ncbi:MAG: permease [Candidatus Aenigmatarchaeota archaeon]
MMHIPQIIQLVIREFLSLTIAVAPFFVIATAIGALIEVYVNVDIALKYLNRGTLSIVNASILGAILPGCACATMPMAAALKEKGIRIGTVSAFIMVSPLLSPQTVILTYGLLGLKFAVSRVLFSLTGAIILGILFNFLERENPRGVLMGKQDECCPTESVSSEGKVKPTFISSFIKTTVNLGKYFILGMFITSLLTVFIPEEAIPKYIGSSGPFAYLVAALLGIPVYICEGEEIPLTKALLQIGLGEGPAFTFLLGSVGTCIPTMLMAQKIIGRSAVLYYIIYWFIFAMGSGVIFGLI